MKVGLVQINTDFGGQRYLPYSVGCLQAYAEKKLRDRAQFDFLLPVYKRMNPHEAVKPLVGADIVFFSLYVWNEQMSYAIARLLKKNNPNVIIAVGGPQIPRHMPTAPGLVEHYLQKNCFIDMAVHGEGEQPFVAILENILGDWKQIPSISYLSADGALVRTLKADRLPREEIWCAPSPYLEGVFNPLMKANPNEKWMVLWETDRGCPYSCTFCGWGGLVQQKVYQFSAERVCRELEWIAERKIEFVFCANANFAIFDRDVQIAQYAADMKKKYGYPHVLSVQNAKNAAERVFQAQYLLAKAGLNKGVTLAFQSRDPQTLQATRRSNISSEGFRELQARFMREGIETYSDMILALANETYDSFSDGVSATIKDGQHNRIQFGNLSNLPDAEMYDPLYRECYGMITQKNRIVTYHGSIFNPEWEVDEFEELIIATDSMPRDEWVRARTFAWMSAFLHFDKIFQIPLIVLSEHYGASYRELIEVFSECMSPEFPTMREVREFFCGISKNIQDGGVEYCAAPEWLDIWWPADEYMFIKMMRENKLDIFYEEAARALTAFFTAKGVMIDPVLLHEAIVINQHLIKRPFVSEDITLHLSYNIYEFYQSVRKALGIPMEKKPSSIEIDRSSETWMSWEDWYRKVVWYGNKKGAYLYGQASEQEKEGHF